MRHVDDGNLHAYLDGHAQTSADERGGTIDRHLAECPECRARLEEERRVRERARAILRAADPADLAAPPYEQVVARAARRKGPSRSLRPAVPWAWAASVALAVTLGWYARTLIGRGREAPQLARSTTIEAAVPAAPAAARDGERRRETATETASTGTQVADASRRVASRPEAGTAASQKRAAEEQVSAERKEEPGFAKARALVDAVQPAPSPPAAPTAMQPLAQRVSAPVLNEAGWTTVSEAEAKRRLGGPIARVPDLAILGYSVSGSGEATVVHTIQVLGPGVTLDLYQQRATARSGERGGVVAARPSVRALRDEAIEPVSVDWEGFRVSARAQVPADSLRALLRKLRAP
jgi:hypothetical protein